VPFPPFHYLSLVPERDDARTNRPFELEESVDKIIAEGSGLRTSHSDSDFS
jgi:hypothetical protein